MNNQTDQTKNKESHCYQDDGMNRWDRQAKECFGWAVLVLPTRDRDRRSQKRDLRKGRELGPGRDSPAGAKPVDDYRDMENSVNQEAGSRRRLQRLQPKLEGPGKAVLTLLQAMGKKHTFWKNMCWKACNYRVRARLENVVQNKVFFWSGRSLILGRFIFGLFLDPKNDDRLPKYNNFLLNAAQMDKCWFFFARPF